MASDTDSSVKKNTKSKGIKIFFALAAVVLLAVSIGVALKSPLYQQGKVAFNARDIGEAADSCETEIINNFGDRLSSKYYDDISSRYEPDKKQYLVYYRISNRVDIDGIPALVDNIVKCVVWERLGYVSHFEVISQ